MAATGSGARHSPELSARLLGLLATWVLRLQCATWRVDVEGLQHLDGTLASGGRVLVVFWHGRYLPLFALLRGRKGYIFSSDSFRGRVICEICRRFGYACMPLPADDSVNRLDFMRAALDTGHPLVALAVDGPLGPRHRVKPGAIRLASGLGFSVVPVSAASRRKRVLTKRWDRMEVPGLFSRVALVVGRAMPLPPDIDAGEISAWQERLRLALESAERKAVDMVSGNRSDPGTEARNPSGR